MNDLNRVSIIGRLTRDIGERDFGFISTGTARLNISIAVNNSKKSNGQWVDEASFFDVTIWGNTAQNLKQYMAKGKQVAIDGRLKQESWTDNNGQKRARVYIIAENVQLLGGNAQQAQPPATAPAPQQKKQNAGASDWQQRFLGDDGNGSEFPEDIPF